jgi:aminoglycoside N3'-acetyltransferase
MTQTLAHTDSRALLANGIRIGDPLDKKHLFAKAISVLEEAHGENVIIPTYNYGFPESRIFDLELTPSDLGFISNEAVRSSEWLREATPVFSHAMRGHQIPATESPFSKGSLFESLLENNSRISFWGVGLERMTFLHFIEDLAKIPYRYEKVFQGSLRTNSSIRDVKVRFHVRPPGGLIDYDFGRLQLHLESRGIWVNVSSRLGEVRARDVAEELSGLMYQDPLYLLSPTSRNEISRLLEVFGRPFLLSDFE